MLKTITELVKETVRFQFFRDGSLYYKTDSGFIFEIPVTDTGTGTFKSEDKGIFFMRWIRKGYIARGGQVEETQHEHAN